MGWDGMGWVVHLFRAMSPHGDHTAANDTVACKALPYSPRIGKTRRAHSVWRVNSMWRGEGLGGNGGGGWAMD